MVNHRSTVSAESDGEFVVIAIRCDACAGGSLKIASAHIGMLAKVLPQICAAAGIDLDQIADATVVYTTLPPPADDDITH